MKGGDLRREGNGFRFLSKTFRVFSSRALPDSAKIKDGSSFSQDRRGNWYLNIVVEIAAADARIPAIGVGIDLGLKDFAALSTGEKIANPRHLKRIASRLAVAQRAHKRRLARTLHARCANTRSDFLHKLSTEVVRNFDYIAVGNISVVGLAKTKLAKSVYDVSWSSFRTMLAYKAVRHGAWYEEIDEKFSSQTCSSCGVIPASSPKGIGALGIRQWVCSECGVSHDRDVNAAKNLLARSGRRSPVVGISGLLWRRERQTDIHS